VHWLFSSRRRRPLSLTLSPLRGERGPDPYPGEGKPIKLTFALLAALFIGGCSVSKWTVRPHQRELLADRIMQLDAQQQERMAEEHILSNREGAIGGTGTAGGGCGCN
jgi:hypothetical protein